ncbi:MAG: hypothetical protein ACYTE5_07260, partial [Planctomycetota bacterium]
MGMVKLLLQKINYILFGLVIVLVIAPAGMAAQFARPDGTVSAGSWTEVNAPSLHEATDEITANDNTDYAQTTTNDDTMELTLSSVTDPQTGTGHVIRFSMMTLGGSAKERCQVQLFQGTSPTPIASTNAEQSRDAYTTHTYTLDPTTEADAISDYSDLRFKVVSSSVDVDETVRVTWVELEVPDAAAAVAPTVSSPTISTIDTTSATLGATVDSNGGAAVTEWGTVWGGSTGPNTNPSGNTSGITIPHTFTESRSGMSAGTLVYYRGYATNSAGTGYSSDDSFYTEPNQASNVGFPIVADTNMRISWTPGTGGPDIGAIVVVREANDVDFVPGDGNEYTANSDFGSGTPLGPSSDNYVLYNGTGSQVDVTGLTASTLYYVDVYEYAGSAGAINYQQDTPATGSQTTTGGGPTVPTLSNQTVTAVDTNSATLWATIDSNGGAPVTARGTFWDTNGPPIDANQLAEGGTGIGTFSHSRTGLPSGTRIYYRGYAVNSEGTGYSPDDSFYTEPALQASNVGFTLIEPTSMWITWDAGDGDGSLVLVKQGSAVDSDPVDGNEHAADGAFGSGEELGTGNYVVYRGSLTQVQVTGLTAATTYHAAVYEYAGSGSGTSGINYQQDTPADGNQATDSAPSGHNGAYNIDCVSCHFAHSGGYVPRDEVQSSRCKSCHSLSGQASDMADVNNHVVNDGNSIIDCGSCHEVHNSYDFNTVDTHPSGQTAANIKLIRWDTAKYIVDACEPAVFQQSPGHFAFGASNPPWNGACQSCHTNTTKHANHNSPPNDHNHEIGGNCLSCHAHEDGFEGSGCTG